MKKMNTKFLTLVAGIALSFTTMAQAPGSIKYQAVLRDAGNLVLNNTTVDMQFTIYEGGTTSVWTNTYSVTSNAYGLVNLDLGPGLEGIFWGSGNYSMETAIDFQDGNGMIVMGTSPLLSVPYALHAATAETATTAETALIDNVDDADNDPTNELQTIVSADANNTITAGTDGGAFLSNDGDWTISGTNMYSAVTDNVGIGTTTPANKLDVTGKITVSESLNDEMLINNDDQWTHSSGLQDFGDGGDHFMVVSREGSGESAGIYGDGDHVTIWSPGDGAPGQPAALLYVNDEDSYDGVTDSDPFNNSALKAYLNTSGNWVAASDKNRKEEIVRLDGSLDKVMMINGYAYKFKLAPAEIEKGDVAPVTYGVIAQEVREVLPEIVDVTADGSHYVSYTELIPVLIEATKEQQKIIDAQQAENEALKLRMLQLEERLNKLEEK